MLAQYPNLMTSSLTSLTLPKFSDTSSSPTSSDESLLSPLRSVEGNRDDTYVSTRNGTIPIVVSNAPTSNETRGLPGNILIKTEVSVV